MDQPSAEYAALAERIGRLERRNRRLMLALVLVPLAALGVGAQSEIRDLSVKRLTAERIVVTDESKSSIVMQADKNGAYLMMNAPDGKPRIRLNTVQFDDGPGIMMTDGNGRDRIAIRLSNKDGPSVRIFHVNDIPIVSMIQGRTNGGMLQCLDAKGGLVAEVGGTK